MRRYLYLLLFAACLEQCYFLYSSGNDLKSAVEVALLHLQASPFLAFADLTILSVIPVIVGLALSLWWHKIYTLSGLFWLCLILLIDAPHIALICLLGCLHDRSISNSRTYASSSYFIFILCAMFVQIPCIYVWAVLGEKMSTTLSARAPSSIFPDSVHRHHLSILVSFWLTLPCFWKSIKTSSLIVRVINIIISAGLLIVYPATAFIHLWVRSMDQSIDVERSNIPKAFIPESSTELSSLPVENDESSALSRAPTVPRPVDDYEKLQKPQLIAGQRNKKSRRDN